MPFKSQAQRRKFAELLVSGKISPDTFEEWNRETGGAKLPERVAKKSKKGVRRAKAPKAKAAKKGSKRRVKAATKKAKRRPNKTTR